MAEQHSSQERTHEPTPKRRRDAAKKGQVLRSRELNTMLMTLGGAITLLFTGGPMIAQLQTYFVRAIALARPQDSDAAIVLGAMEYAQEAGLGMVLPLFAILTLLALAGPLVMGGVTFRISAIAPKAEKLSPIKGLQRMFGVRSVMELVKSILKFVLVVAAGLALVAWSAPELVSIGSLSIENALGQSASLLGGAFVVLSAVLIVIAGIDVPFQAQQHLKQLRMTYQEVQDEMKETEGRPEIKRRQRQLQMEAAQGRLAAEVPQATVVINNPTHYSVALRYEDGQTAPVVVARGAGEIALAIRQLAKAHEVPMVSAPPLARALYFGVTEGEQIPAELYRAVAQILIYIMQLEQSRRAAARPPKAPVIGDADIPPHLRRGADS